MVSIKLFFGLSYLSMPNTFRLGGVIGGTILLTFVVTINLVTMLQCLAVAKHHPGVRSYSELGFRVLGSRGKLCVDICTVIT
jgi:amino acid permease